MTTVTTTTSPETILTRAERRALRSVRSRYAEHLDLFSSHELYHFRFLRWLVQTGRLTP